MISNEELEDILKIIKAFEDSGLLIKSASETTANGAKEQKGGVLGILLGTLGTILLGIKLLSKDVIRDGNAKIELLHFEPKSNGVYPRNNSPKIKDGVYVMSRDE